MVLGHTAFMSRCLSSNSPGVLGQVEQQIERARGNRHRNAVGTEQAPLPGVENKALELKHLRLIRRVHPLPSRAFRRIQGALKAFSSCGGELSHAAGWRKPDPAATTSTGRAAQ